MSDSYACNFAINLKGSLKISEGNSTLETERKLNPHKVFRTSYVLSTLVVCQGELIMPQFAQFF